MHIIGHHLLVLFSGLRLGEITSLYLDNIKEISGNHREKRWCFDIVEEPKIDQTNT